MISYLQRKLCAVNTKLRIYLKKETEKKRCPTSVCIREMPVKIKGSHPTCTRTAAKTHIPKHQYRRSEPVPCGWEHEALQPPWDKHGNSLQELRTELPYDPTIPFLGIESSVLRRLTVHSGSQRQHLQGPRAGNNRSGHQRGSAARPDQGVRLSSDTGSVNGP